MHFLLTMFQSAISFAQQASPAMATATPAALAAVQHANSMLPAQLSTFVVGGAVIAIELVMRVFPTAQPRSLLLLCSQLLTTVASMFQKVSGYMDQVVQNLQDPSAK